MLERLERSEGLGTIYPAMMNSIFALLAEGRDTTDPVVAREIDFLERYEIEEERQKIRCACSLVFLRCGTPRSPWSRSRRRGLIPRIRRW